MATTLNRVPLYCFAHLCGEESTVVSKVKFIWIFLFSFIQLGLLVSMFNTKTNRAAFFVSCTFVEKQTRNLYRINLNRYNNFFNNYASTKVKHNDFTVHILDLMGKKILLVPVSWLLQCGSGWSSCLLWRLQDYCFYFTLI